MKPVADMTVNEAAGLALSVILAGLHEESQKRAKENGYDWYNPEQTWQDALAAEYDLDVEDDGNWADLEENESAWKQVKYEGGEYTQDGYTANRVAEHGGEGEGDQYWVVISLSDGTTTRHFRKDGWYASYGSGGYLDGDTTEVKPVERTVLFYE